MRVQLKPLLSGDCKDINSLQRGREYAVIGIEADSTRIINDAHEPCLYEPRCFEVVDATEPSFWVCMIGDDGERYCYPQAWSALGFFEDYFDGVLTVQQQFWRDYARLYQGAA